MSGRESLREVVMDANVVADNKDVNDYIAR